MPATRAARSSSVSSINRDGRLFPSSSRSGSAEPRSARADSARRLGLSRRKTARSHQDASSSSSGAAVSTEPSRPKARRSGSRNVSPDSVKCRPRLSVTMCSCATSPSSSKPARCSYAMRGVLPGEATSTSIVAEPRANAPRRTHRTTQARLRNSGTSGLGSEVDDVQDAAIALTFASRASRRSVVSIHCSASRTVLFPLPLRPTKRAKGWNGAGGGSKAALKRCNETDDRVSTDQATR